MQSVERCGAELSAEHRMLCNGTCREGSNGVERQMMLAISTTRRLDNNDDCTQ